MGRKARGQGFFIRWLVPLTAGAALSAGGLLYVWQSAERDGLVDARPTMLDFGGTPLIAGGRPAIPPGDTPSPTVGAVSAAKPASSDPVGDTSQPPAHFEAVFPRVTVLDATRFKALRSDSPLVVHLGGVTGLSFSQSCDGPAGRWNCGARARADLARLIGPRSVGCVNMRVSEDDGESLADCWVGSRNLSSFMVSRGWVEPIDPADRRFAPDAAKAKADRLGVHGDGAVPGLVDDAD